jgi:hypothetical protein
VPTQVVVVVGSSEVTIDVPAGNSLTQLVVATPSPTDVLSPPDSTLGVVPGTAIDVSATDATGRAVYSISPPMTITISFRSPPGVNPLASHLYTMDLNGQIADLPATATALGHGAYAVSATTSLLAQFVVCAPDLPSMQVRAFLPVVKSVAVASGW